MFQTFFSTFQRRFVLFTVAANSLLGFIYRLLFFADSNDITTFGESSFLNFVLTLNTTLKRDSLDIAPTWELWDGAIEMLFNVTKEVPEGC